MTVLTADGGSDVAVSVSGQVFDGGQSLYILGDDGNGDVLLTIGEDASLVIGATVVGDACEANCGFSSINVTREYAATGAGGGGVVFDFTTNAVVSTDAYVSFEVTCASYSYAEKYVATGASTSETVYCPYKDLYDSGTLSDLTCARYESEWCSAGILTVDDDSNWSDDSSWLNGVAPSACVISAMSRGFLCCCVAVSLGASRRTGQKRRPRPAPPGALCDLAVLVAVNPTPSPPAHMSHDVPRPGPTWPCCRAAAIAVTQSSSRCPKTPPPIPSS
jgi:hypothetical protein